MKYAPIPGAIPQWEQCPKIEATEHFDRLPSHEYRTIFDHRAMDRIKELEAALDALEGSMTAILSSDSRRAGPAALVPIWLKDIRAARRTLTGGQKDG